MNVADVYERHVRVLPVAERLRMVSLIASDLAVEGVTAPERPRLNLTDLEGLGKEIWEGVDAQEYVDRLRGPWPDEVP